MKKFLVYIHQAMEFRPNFLDDDVTGIVVVDFHGPQIDTVDTKSTQRDIIIEQIRPKFHSLTHTHTESFVSSCSFQ